MFELERYAAILLVFDDRETNDAHERERYLGEGGGKYSEKGVTF